MINFRYHLVSIIAVFLALGIGIIMGTAVIDRAVVDRLERQQSGLRSDIDGVRSDNAKLKSQLNQERDASKQLADQGSERLLTGTLPQVPVLLVGVRGGSTPGVDDLVTLLGRSGAVYGGTLWLTDRFALSDDAAKRDLAQALDLRADGSTPALRVTALTRLVRGLRIPADTAVLDRLRAAGFLDFDPPDGRRDESLPTFSPTTRVVVVATEQPDVPDRSLAVPFLHALLADRDDQVAPGTLLVGPGRPAGTNEDSAPTLVAQVREDEALSGRLSSVDDIDSFAGRVAAVLALADLGAGRSGHYGTGPGAQRLLPAPAE